MILRILFSIFFLNLYLWVFVQREQKKWQVGSQVGEGGIRAASLRRVT